MSPDQIKAFISEINDPALKQAAADAAAFVEALTKLVADFEALAGKVKALKAPAA